MSNIHLDVTTEKNWRLQNLDFLSLKDLSAGQFLGSSNSRRYHWIFKTSVFSLKIRGLGAKKCVASLLF